jgi:2-dehydro-3-deoxyphosphogluconate aldolase / (4S)-4-hydroxy-2-oxoglutarate aldolase
MNNELQALGRIGQGRIVAILRGDFTRCVEEVAAVIFQAGITAVEVTLNSPGAIECIRRLDGTFGNRMAVGAGTVLKPIEVEAAADAGARFIVSPNMAPAVIQRTKQLGLVSVPGCLTPTEIVSALDAGADAVKLFPANVLGPGFLRALRGPLPEVRTMPTGGVTSEAAKLYLQAGAWALGIGSELIRNDFLAPEGKAQLASRAAAFAAAVRE